jgi:hypothetical protein
MDFPPDWDVNPLGEYEIAAPVVPAASTAHTLELLAQLRPTGRILDGFRLSMDGPLLERQLDLGQLIPVNAFKGYRLQFQFWPRDIQIRRNMMSSAWIDVPALICSNEAQVLDERGREVAADQFMELLESLPEEGPESGSLRWAVVIGDDGDPRLQLQSLPSDAVSLSGRPATKG